MKIINIEIRKILGVLLLVLIISIGFLKPVQDYISIPKELVLIEGQQKQVTKAFPVFKMSSNNETVSVDGDHFTLKAEGQGNANVTLTVGNTPVKEVNVRVLKDIKVVPGDNQLV